jgi:Tol biopolymer transport system component
MGEVFRARDTRLGREVAIKVIGGDDARDADRRQRFQREARAIASLAHSNICAIHDVGAEAGTDYLVLELLEGESLAARLRRGALPLDEALARAIEMARALDHAHGAGIIHRDLKPANVMLTPAGAKVLDFGLARITRGDTDAPAAAAVTVTAPLTGAGAVLGTAPYMAPEQIEGRAADARTDVFAFGATLFEMLTGRRAFEAETTPGLIGAIVRGDTPSLLALKPDLPPALDRLVRTCLDKDPRARFASMHDVAIALQWVRDDTAARLSSSKAATPAAGGRSLMASSLALLGGAVLGAAGVAVWLRAGAPREAPEPSSASGSITVASVTTEDGLEQFPSLSPDGKWVVYTADERGSGQTDIFLRAVGERNTFNLTRDSAAADFQPSFSPDGERIAFRSERDGGGLFVMGRTGESVRRLTAEGFNPSWSPDGSSIVYGLESVTTNPGARRNDDVLWIVSVATGDRRQLTMGGDAVQPSWSPHGQRIAYWAMFGDLRQRDIWTVPAGGGPPLRVTDDAAIDWNPVWSPDGQHLYFSSNRSGLYGLWRVAIDESSGRRMGDPEAVPLARAGVAHYSFSRDGGALAMASLMFQSNIEAIAFDLQKKQTGERRRLTNNSETGVIPASGTSTPALSPDGQWLSFAHESAGGQQDLWVMRTDGTGLRELTSDPGRDNAPSWFPDGKRLLFRSERGGRFQAWTIAADGSAPMQVTDETGVVSSIVLAPDARRAAASMGNTSRQFMFDPRVPAAQQKPETLPPPPDDRFQPASWSPDGTRIAGFLLLSRLITIYSVAARAHESFPQTTNGVSWAGDNRTLLFSTGQDLGLLDTATGASRVIWSSPAEFIGTPVLAPDGRSLYLSITKPQGDIVIASLPREPGR